MSEWSTYLPLSSLLVCAYHTAGRLFLATGRWILHTTLWLVDWTTNKTIAALNLTTRLFNWVGDHPVSAFKYLALGFIGLVLFLMLDIYIYDRIKRRSSSESEGS